MLTMIIGSRRSIRCCITSSTVSCKAVSIRARLTLWTENPKLVYAILQSHQDFQGLATFTLVSGLREIQRRKALRAAGMCDHLPT